MTLIIKELIIRGKVLKDEGQDSSSSLSERELKNYLAKMQRDIERKCVDKVLTKLERERRR